MRALFFLIVVATWLPAGSGKAHTMAADLWHRADSFYAVGQYDSALAYYLQYGELEGYSVGLHYNLGSAYYRLHELGPAVLHFEKARFLAPGDQQIKENLQLTKSQIPHRIAEQEPVFFIRWWEAATRADLSNFWAISSLVLFLVLLALGWARYFSFSPSISLKAMAGGAMVLCVFLVLAYYAADRRRDSGKAVVMAANAPLQLSPEPGTPSSLIPEGTTVRWGTERGGWVELTLPDGRKGWMEKVYLEKI